MIKIKKSHEGRLTKAVGKAGLSAKSLKKEIATAKKTGNVKLEREEVFAKNSKGWKHGGKIRTYVGK